MMFLLLVTVVSSKYYSSSVLSLYLSLLVHNRRRFLSGVSEQEGAIDFFSRVLFVQPNIGVAVVHHRPLTGLYISASLQCIRERACLLLLLLFRRRRRPRRRRLPIQRTSNLTRQTDDCENKLTRLVSEHNEHLFLPPIIGISLVDFSLSLSRFRQPTCRVLIEHTVLLAVLYLRAALTTHVHHRTKQREREERREAKRNFRFNMLFDKTMICRWLFRTHLFTQTYQ